MFVHQHAAEALPSVPDRCWYEPRDIATRAEAAAEHIAAGLCSRMPSTSTSLPSTRPSFASRRAGAEIRVSSPVTGLARWRRMAGLYSNGNIDCASVVNASGAWGDTVARLAGIEPMGLAHAPNRSWFPVITPTTRWPFVVDVEQLFYFRPDGAQLLCSLARRYRSPRLDPRPTWPTSPLAIEQINEAATLDIRSVNSQMDRVADIRPGPGDGHRGGADCPGFSGWSAKVAPASRRLPPMALSLPVRCSAPCRMTCRG